jgi:hypothetical protein
MINNFNKEHNSDSDKDNDSDDSILFKNKDIVINRVCKNNYTIKYNMENNHIILSKILDFNIIRLVYDLNKDFFENIQINIIDENNAFLFILVKPLFSDFGMPQRYAHLKIVRHQIDSEYVIFNCHKTEDETEFIKSAVLPPNVELLPIDNIKLICKCLTPHLVEFQQNIFYDTRFNIPKFMEKMAGIIFSKMFLRTKQFIENIRM